MTDLAFKRLRVLNWQHYEFESPALLTSDAGVGILRPNPDPGGFLPHRGIVLLPLTPTSLAVAATKSQQGQLKTEGDQLATIANQALCDAAHHETFRHPDMPWPKHVLLGSEGPRLNLRLLRPQPGAPIPVDATSALQNRYSRPGMHEFLRDLMDRLNESLPLDPSDESS